MVLLVDNDDLFRKALASNLRDDGCEVQEYDTTRSIALDQLPPVRALLIDWRIENPHGRRFVERFHALHPTVPVFVITTASGNGFNPMTADASYITFLPKPLDYEALVEALRARTLHSRA